MQLLLFLFIIANQFTNIDFVNEIILFILDFKIILVFVVLARFIFIYYQQVLIKNLKFNIKQNLKVYLLNEIFEKSNYSVADAYFYVNTLSGHISFFYSNFASFATSILQIIIYVIYLLMVDLQSIGIFLIGVLILIYPIRILISSARSYMDKTYYKTQDANREIQRVVENMFLIKILKR